MTDTVDVVVEKPLCRHAVYVFDERLQRIRLHAIHDSETRPFELGFIEDHGERLPVILLSNLPTFEGCVVEARVLTAVVGEPGSVIVASPVHQDAREIEPLRASIVQAAAELLQAPQGGMGLSLTNAVQAAACVKAWRREVRSVAARRATVLTAAAWRAERPREPGGPHTWAEKLLLTLPGRFQDYIAELLFDDERVIYYLGRPAMRGPWLRGGNRKAHEGLFLMTDRAVFFMEDAIPPDSTMVHWGYKVDIVAIEQVRSACLEVQPSGVSLRLNVESKNRQVANLSWLFPRSHHEALDEAMPLLNSFAGPGGLLPRRLYRPQPAGDSCIDLASEEVIAENDRGRVVLNEESLLLEANGRIIGEVALGDVTSLSLLRSLMGCEFVVRSVVRGVEREVRSGFRYPQAPAFLRLSGALRVSMGNPT